MSIARVQSFAFSGIEAVPVEVQVQVSSGLPAFLVVACRTRRWARRGSGCGRR